LRQRRARDRSGADGRRGRRHRHFAGDAGARRSLCPRSPRAGTHAIGGAVELRLSADSYDLIVSEFTLHHLPDFWKAVAMSRIFRALKPGATFYLRDLVYAAMPDAIERDVEQWADFQIKNHDFPRESFVTHMRDEYSTFGWVMERMLTDVGFTLASVDYHAPMHGTYVLRKPDKQG
jgi:SAM-dependent methyltransferase